MNADDLFQRTIGITSGYLGPKISPEQFIQEHFFIYVPKGEMTGHDGQRQYTLQAGQYCLVRKNQLARYDSQRVNGQLEKVVVVFDTPFLQRFAAKHPPRKTGRRRDGAFLRLQPDPRVPAFLRTLAPMLRRSSQLSEAEVNNKREELLQLLLEQNPEMTDVLFDFATPQKINLESFMNQHFRFNVSLKRFAYLTGRSLSAFKRDFAAVFSTTPSRWLTHKRLLEARFLIESERRKPSEIYLEVGFEDLSHFSFAFKKKFGLNASVLLQRAH
jgi:AraC family transcriptional regulator, exoenzyme S synthesis regulatory protein ExsA